LTTEITSDAETEDIGDGSGKRVRGRENVLIFLVASYASFDFRHDESYDFALQSGCQREEASVVLCDFLIPLLGIFHGKAVFAKDL